MKIKVWQKNNYHVLGILSSFNINDLTNCYGLQIMDILTLMLPIGQDILPLWTELSQKYLGKDKSVFRGVVQDSIYDVTV